MLRFCGKFAARMHPHGVHCRKDMASGGRDCLGDRNDASDWPLGLPSPWAGHSDFGRSNSTQTLSAFMQFPGLRGH